MPAPTSNAPFQRSRRIVFGIVLASFVLSFFHRTAPAAIAGELTQAFSISSTVLGTVAATYFYVYTLLQIPVGVLADTLGPRRILTAGSLIAGAGSLAFALAPTWEIAAAGRTLVGIGVSVAFISVLKIGAMWFPARRFATLTGVTQFAGNMGAVFAGAPLAWVVTWMSWRSVFVVLAVLSCILGFMSWLLVRDRPEDRGFAPVVAPPAHGVVPMHWTHALRDVLRNRATWPVFFVNIGIGGTFLAWAGLWSVPFLRDVYGMTRIVAAQHASLLLMGLAFGAVVVGLLSDHLGNRHTLMRIYALLYACSWLPWVLHAPLPLWGSYVAFLAMGFLSAGFVLSWTVAKEVNRPEHSGIATGVVNVGIFLGTGVLQPLLGWVLDRGREAGTLTEAYVTATLVLCTTATMSFVAAFFVHRSRAAR